MLIARGRYSPGEDVWLSDCCLCKNVYHITVIVPGPNVLAAEVFWADIFTDVW